MLLYLSNYAAMQEFKDTTGVDTTSNLAAKKYIVALKTEVGKLDIGSLVNVANVLNNLKTEVDDLNVKKCSS